MTRRAIVIGASSGIGRELARQLAADGYAVGIASRRTELLNELAAELPGEVLVKTLDASKPDEAMTTARELIDELGGVDLFVISAGTGFINPELEWDKEQQTIDVNVAGFTALANVAMHHFLAQGSGHLVGISSIAGIRGNRQAPAYSASKAFVSNYLEGMWHKAAKSRLPITVTDVQPGYVDTAMAKGGGQFWVASPEEAARQILAAIRRKRRRVYVTRRWRMIAWLFKTLPASIYRRF